MQINQGGGQMVGQFYGAYKQSGVGREVSLEAMLAGVHADQTDQRRLRPALPPQFLDDPAVVFRGQDELHCRRQGSQVHISPHSQVQRVSVTSVDDDARKPVVVGGSP